MLKENHIPKSTIDENILVCGEIKRILPNGRKYLVESYGCQMNEHEAQKLRAMLALMGYESASSKEEADLILFNTCCVREHAELRVFGNVGALKKLKDEKPWLIVGICGCMMQQRKVSDHLFKRFPFVDIIFGTNELHDFPKMVQCVLNGERVKLITDSDGTIAEGLPVQRESSFSTYVNIMYGCNNFCTYCIVPYVRGRERSRQSSDILDEIRELASQGCREITLLGQNVNSYKGEDDINFPKLLSMVNDIEGISRIRFMTSHPKDLSDMLVEAMASLDKVCAHIHLPVQSGSSRILKAMNRGYTRDRYLELIDKLRSRVAGIGITTDIIVGFPGETDDDYRETLSLMEQVRFGAAYTFMYSRRNGTKAAAMQEQVDESVKRERLHELNALEASILRQDNMNFIGKEGTVLVEGVDSRNSLKPLAFGKLDNFKMVYFPNENIFPGSLVRVKITAAENNSLMGERI